MKKAGIYRFLLFVVLNIYKIICIYGLKEIKYF